MGLGSDLILVGSLGRNFVDNWFVASQWKAIQNLLNVRGDVNLWVRVTHEIHKQ